MKVIKFTVIFLVVVSASFLSVGFISPSVTYETIVLVDKPVAHCFSVFNNPFNMNKWMPGFKSINVLSGLPNEVGSKWELVFEEGGEEIVVVEEMTGFERNKLFAFNLSGDVLKSKVKITFEEVDGKTKITATTIATANNFVLRSLFPLMKSTFEARELEAYTNLKKLIESEDYHNDLMMELRLNQG